MKFDRQRGTKLKALSAGNRKPAVEFCLYLYVFSGALVSCRGKKEGAPWRKGAIETIDGKTAKEVLEKIRTPVKKVRSVEDIQKVRPSDAAAVSGFIFGVAAMPR